ncbi:MAG: hypothetical protein IPI12_09175 [Ignavibacteriales bacterium]|mgnify:FL=1|jgi:hypothetical protein|nr:hypothetical protein [Ignavibacteriales bacterium]MBK8662707.1 hypothetical protein [Ignavibacteriales bacterium]MCC6637298.1 hypothetical protein [Ignavibacteriaceae bacterium]
MQQETTWYRWDIKKGDYTRDADYDRLYFKGKKREKIYRAAMWLGVAVIVSQVFLKVLAYASRM